MLPADGQTQDLRDFTICMQRALIEELCRYLAAQERRMRGEPILTIYQGANAVDENNTMTGSVTIQLIGPDGKVKSEQTIKNLITDTGDSYYAGKMIAAIAPASAAAPTALTGMQIGSGATAVAKSGAGAAMVTLLAGQAFDATFPSTANLGAGLGVNAVYKTTYAAGVGTGSVTEATLTNGAIGTASTAGNTIARILFAAVAKGAGDSLSISWNNKALGA